MTDKDWPRFAITAAIVGMFAGALAFHYSTGLEETLKAVVMLAVGYWLGSSKGSADKSTQLAEQASGTQQVEVVNPPDDPVPVTRKEEAP